MLGLEGKPSKGLCPILRRNSTSTKRKSTRNMENNFERQLDIKFERSDTAIDELQCTVVGRPSAIS